MRVAVTLLAAVIVALAAVLFGAWWAPFTVGIVIGIVEPRARVAIPLGAAAGLVAWALPLASLQLHYGAGAAAGALAAIMGFGRSAALPVILTSLVGLLLGLTGAWLASAARSLVTAR